MAVFEDIKSKAELLDLRTVYEQETGMTLTKNQGPCIFCNSGHGTHSSSDGAFSIRPSTNMAHCFSCGASAGVVSLVMHVNKLEFKQAIEYIARNYFHETIDEHEKIKVVKREYKQWTKPTAQEEKEENEKRKRTFDFLKNLCQGNANNQLAVAYLKSRSIDTAILPVRSFFQAEKYNDLPEGVVFFDSEEKLLNKRYITNDLPKGVAKSFNYGELQNAVYDAVFISQQDTVYVTEGVINALSFYSIGRSAIALFSTNNYINNVEKFRKYFDERNVIISFDYDFAGQRSAIKNAEFIFNNFTCKSLKIMFFPTYQDKEGKTKAYDVNDLLKFKQLIQHIGISYNYIVVNQNYINSQLEYMKDNTYMPNAEYQHYSYTIADKEKDTFKVSKAKNQKELAEKYSLPETVNAYFLESYWIVKNGIKHNFTATENNIFVYVDMKEGSLIWKPQTTEPFEEITILKNFDFNILGKEKFRADIETATTALQVKISETEDKNERKKLMKKKPVQSLFICFNMLDFLKMIELKKEALLLLEFNIDFDFFTKQIKDNVQKIYLLPNNTSKQILAARSIGLFYIDFYIYNVEKDYKSIAELIEKTSEYNFFRRLNVALPYKFWNWNVAENFDIKLNLIAFLNFAQTKGFFTYEDQKDKRGYQYIKIENRIVKSFDDKELFVRIIRDFTNKWLEERGESIEIRNKILMSGDFSEKNVSQLKQIQLDFENSGKTFQNFFFTDGNMWIITNGKINCFPQTKIRKHIWEQELIDYPSRIQSAPFHILYSEKYQKINDQMKLVEKGSAEYFQLKTQRNNIPDIKKYQIEILDRNNYFLELLWLTSYIHWRDAEKKGYEYQRKDFWHVLEEKQILEQELIDEMKLHLINKITWIGYFMRDYRGPEHDYGMAILDAIDIKSDGLKRDAAGGGKSLITFAIASVKRTMRIKADSEDFTENKHRYENYNGERIIVLDDMHKNSRIGDILTDFSLGIQVNPKHKKPIEFTLEKSPKIIITRNYIDDEGNRVDRRLGRIFVSDFFHKAGPKYKEERKPFNFFGRSLLTEDSDQDKTNLINFFGYSYIANQQFGEISSPVDELEHYRIIKTLGEPLIEFMDIFLQERQGYIDLLWLFTKFKNDYSSSFTAYQKTKLYNTTTSFKRLVEMYCQVNDYIYNPEELLNEPKDDPKRIISKSQDRLQITAEHIFIVDREKYQSNIYEKEEAPEKEEKTIQELITEYDEVMPF